MSGKGTSSPKTIIRTAGSKLLSVYNTIDAIHIVIRAVLHAKAVSIQNMVKVHDFTTDGLINSSCVMRKSMAIRLNLYPFNADTQNENICT